MEWKIIEYGIFLETNEIYIIQKLNNQIYSGYINSLEYGYPEWMTKEAIEKYAIEHDTEGYSCIGTYEQVKKEICE